MARGRPVSTAPTWDCQIHLRLRVGEDDDLIAFLGNIPPRRRAKAIKSALRTGGVSLSQVEADSSEMELLVAVDDFLK
jgi:hypothetical protein